MPTFADLIPAWARDPSFLLERALAVALVLLLVWLAYAGVARALRHAAASGRVATPVADFVRGFLRLGAVVAAVLLSLQTLGLLKSALATLAAMLAMIAIGFVAVWSVASNFLCSVILLVSRPFYVGDRITLLPDPVEGRVVNFNMLYTTLETDDGAFLQVPNNLFFQRIVSRRPADRSGAAIELQDQLPRSENAQ